MLSLDPVARFYKPQGVPMRFLEVVKLADEELEAIHLADFLGLEQEEAAQRMGISRSTFSRALTRARRQVATALVRGTALQIGSGPVAMPAEADEDDAAPA